MLRENGLDHGCYKIVGVKRERSVILLGRYLAKYNPNEQGSKDLLPQNRMLPKGIVGEGAFGKRVEDSIKFIFHGLS
jgi:hypothetical protein